METQIDPNRFPPIKSKCELVGILNDWRIRHRGQVPDFLFQELLNRLDNTCTSKWSDATHKCVERS